MGEIFIDSYKPMYYNVYVDERQMERRKEFIELLEENGYNLDKDEKQSKEDIIDCVLPIDINPAKKEYRMMGNITCAAAAATQKLLISREDFREKYLN